MPSAALYSAYALALAGIHALTMRQVSQPYMDEPFHVAQTQEYCAGRWDVWDDKITTFPGLYVLVAAAARVIRLVTPASSCTFQTLRALNLIPGLLTPWMVHANLRIHHPSTPTHDLVANAVLASLLPTHFFFHFLFYTDSASTCSVLLLLLLAPRERRDATMLRQLAFALAGALAISLRQTNAVWVAFAVASAALRTLFTDAVLTQHARGVRAALAEFATKAPRPLAALAASHYAAPLVLLGAFGGFVVANGGVVVGDRSNHQPSCHLAQLLYLTVLVAAPHAAWRFWPPNCPHAARAAAAALRAASPLAILAAFAACVLAALTTRSHPFLLADNRHITFYLWRHLLGRHKLVPLALTPGYLLLGSTIYPALWKAQGPLLALGLAACCALVLVPSPLIEPRYYTLPTLIIWLHAPPLTGAAQWLPPLVVFGLVNVAMLAVFLFRPYEWGDGSVAHFMW